jgi:hypothetical protein
MSAHLMAIPDAGVFDYPVGSTDRLDGHSFVKWQFHRWMSSDMYLMSSFEAQGMALALFCIAQTQTPAGTLPPDRQMIARLLRVDQVAFENLCRHQYGPLHNWTPCRADDGKMRLYHPVVLEQVLDALDRRERRSLVNSDRAVRQRKRRLVDALRAAGVDASVLANQVFVDRCDGWLCENWRTNRDEAAYSRVLSVAAREKWFNA